MVGTILAVAFIFGTAVLVAEALDGVAPPATRLHN
jgi:hypothetical protein